MLDINDLREERFFSSELQRFQSFMVGRVWCSRSTHNIAVRKQTENVCASELSPFSPSEPSADRIGAPHIWGGSSSFAKSSLETPHKHAQRNA
jgi:hypothetical protein